MTEKIKAWSFSRYQVYAECPAKAKYKFIDKLPEPPAPAMERGTLIHKLAEEYAKGSLKTLPKELKSFGDQFKELRKSEPMLEQQWAFDKTWKPTGWFDCNTWVRVKVDVACKDGDTLYVIDHKTGKPKPDHKDQLDLYAVAGMSVDPEIKKVSTQVWYLDTSGQMLEQEFPATDLLKLRKQWNDKTRAMLNDTTFSPKPGNSCRWCAFSKMKGGSCRF